MWLEWPDRVDKYIDEAITKLTEERYFRFINMVYLVNEMFEEDVFELSRKQIKQWLEGNDTYTIYDPL